MRMETLGILSSAENKKNKKKRARHLVPALRAPSNEMNVCVARVVINQPQILPTYVFQEYDELVR